MQAKREILTPRNEKDKNNDKVKVILRIRPLLYVE